MTTRNATTARRTTPTSLRTASRLVLAAGAVLALAAAFGPVWLVRAGLVCALVAGFVAVGIAWREAAQARRAHATQMLAASRAHGTALSAERKHNGSVVDTLADRVAAARAEVAKHQVTIAELTSEVSTLHGDNAFLRGEVSQREKAIAALRETVRAREAELIALRDEGDDAEVRTLPRRVLAEHESVWEQLPAADELWTDGSHPTVVDLKMLQTAMVLPNYEEDRKHA